MVEPSRRPADGRYGENPFRLGAYYQYQVILKPAPTDVLPLYLESLRHLGIDSRRNDFRFVEDDWEAPTLGGSGLGWEVWWKRCRSNAIHLLPTDGRHRVRSDLR